MGLNGMETICEQLKQHGLDAQTPAALIEKGTTDRQQVFIGDLDSLPGDCAQRWCQGTDTHNCWSCGEPA